MITTSGKIVAVIGGGITGLSAAYRLSTTRPDLRVVLFEASDRLGGQITTIRDGGGWVERGADSFLARDPFALDLCHEIGLEDKLRKPAVFGAYVWLEDRLCRMPPNVFGIPTDVKRAVASGVLSAKGASRATMERKTKQPLSGNDVSVAKFISRRFGREVLHRMVDPLLAGTRAGDPRDLSLAAAMPEIDDLARRTPSILKTMAGREPEPPPFFSLEGGLETIIDALRRAIPAVSLQLHTPVSEIHVDETGYSLRFDRRDQLHTEGVVLAVPPPYAAPLVTPIDAELARGLTELSYSRSAIVTLSFPAGSVQLPEDGSGMLVPGPDMKVIAACTWWSQKWPGTTEHQVLRCFVGRAGADALMDQPDDRLARHVLMDLRDMLPVPAPVSVDVARWEVALPIFKVGHLDRVADLRHRVASHPGLAIAGIPERGSGITECVRRAFAAADQASASVRESAR